VDITALDHVESENRANRAMVSIMKNIAAFKDFLGESQERLAHAVHGIVAGDDGIVRRELHTLKGNSAAFGLEYIASVIHQIEDQTKISAKSISEIETAFSEFLDAHYNLLRVKFGERHDAEFLVTDEEISSLLSFPDGSGQADMIREHVANWSERVRLVKVGELLGPLENYVTKLAVDHGKDIEFIVVGGSVRVNPAHVKFVIHSLIHLIRNSIDHGIEVPEDRMLKSPRARLSLEFLESANDLIVKISDDGKGIDTKQVVVRALRLGAISQERAKSISHAEALNLVYVEGVSTANAVSDTSGRGVGMAAVLASVEDAGGKITIESNLGIGTTFTRILPRMQKAQVKHAA
jgi:chemotaxis protein histidine kinase CheA